MRFSLLAAGLAALMGIAVASPATAQDNRASSRKRKARDPNEQVCKNEEVLGSRLAVRRVCMSRSEWAQRQLEDRQRTEQTQLQRHAIGN
jgi:hypothetical protein